MTTQEAKRRVARKYNNKFAYVDGERLDSKKEARRYRQLKAMEEAGEISELRRQIPFVLIPKQELQEPRKLRENRYQRHESACRYFADFVYKVGDKTIVEDTKGVKTPDYIIKRKLMLQIYGIQIKEV